MASSLYQQLSNTQMNPMFGNIKNMMNLMKQSNNPMQMMLNMAGNNNALAQVLKEVQANGGDAKSLFYKKAQQMGVDPNTVLNQLR